VVLEGDEAIKKRPGLYPIEDLARLIDKSKGDNQAMILVNNLRKELIKEMKSIEKDS
jgi:hypothetical protein